MKKINVDLKNIKKIHMIGIGGSGMCPLAEILTSKGYTVSGSDNYESDTLKRLKKQNLKIYMSHDKKNIKDCDLVVYSAAIKRDNPEIVGAIEKNIPVIERAEMLGIITSTYKNLIAVSGTHGKTSTTSMITQILTEADADPTAIIGGKLPFLGGNSRIGKSQNIVCEACEYVDTFLNLNPAISIILNVDSDHLDYFKNLDGVINSFNKFAKKTTDLLIINGDDANSIKATKDVKIPIIKIGMNSTNKYYAQNIVESKGICVSFDVLRDGKKLMTAELSVPGKHNLYNALAAIAVADYMGLSLNKTKIALKSFTGVHRRFEILGNINNITIADDFAHHPTEIKATLSAAKNMGYKRVITIFQPHTYSRTSMFLNEFAEALKISDLVILSEILAVREKNTYNIHSEDLQNKIDGCIYLKTFEEISEYILKIAKPNDLILTMGGGNIYECANMIINKMKEKN